MNMEVEVDEELLKRIAARTGGEFFQAVDPGGLRRVFDRIDQLEKTPLQVKRYVRYQEIFQPVVWAALALLVLPLFPALGGKTLEP
jgi:Ca-activated chloride channel homolog